ncbi:molecular chaperone DnaK [bacterium]|nr:molecular chaperone DnaK [bacterium]
MGQIVGIDLGTTNSLVAAIVDGQPTLIPNERGRFLTPSVVGFTETGELLVGDPAKNQAVANPERTITSIKRLMGTDRRITIGDKEFSPQEISAVILKKLKLDAETYLNDVVDEAIITVPAYFTDAQRQATKDAGEVAGFLVERIINEPTAAALSYGFDKMDARTVLVYDLGGGTFDVSIIRQVEGAFKVLATTGNNSLGGDDFDYRVVEWLIEQFKGKEKVDLRTISDVSQQRAIMQRLKEASENAKIDLSSLLETSVNLPFIYTGGDEPLHLNETLTRAKYEDLVQDLIDQTLQPLELALSDANIEPEKLDAIILVGGMTRTPAIQRLVKNVTAKDPYQEINPEECVALGAAIQAGIKRGQLQELVVVDVAPFTLGIETEGNKFSSIIPRNTSVPCSRKSIYKTTIDEQTEALIHVLQGESVSVMENSSLGEFVLSGITPSPRGESLVEVNFDYDVNGIVQVTAKDRKTGMAKGITIKASKARLTEDDIALAERDVAKMGGAMIAQREKGKVLFEGQGVYERMKTLEKQVADGAKKMKEVELSMVKSLIGNLEEALKAEEEEKLEEIIEKSSIILSDWGM